MELIAQSTKQTYKYDIEDSIKHKTLYKNFEYFDDYSYSTSDKIGLYIRKNKDKYEIIFFQEDGPKTKEALVNMIRWRLSGKSDEVGHKGGGNKRNLYGFNADKFTIFMRNNDTVFRCGAFPNKMLEFANKNLGPHGETVFRAKIDSNEYISWPEEEDLDEMPSWYSVLYEKILNESCFEPNYMIKMELNDLPKEYSNKMDWSEYINQVRAKQYKIEIHFKNEILGMDEYKKYGNIDLVGDGSKEHSIIVGLYLNGDVFYLKVKDKYISIDTPTNGPIEDITGLVHWGDIDMYIMTDKYFNTQLKEFNIGAENKARADDFYGVYLKLNGKLTNYLPVGGNPLPMSKNNKIDDGKSNNKFRMVIVPNNKNCIEKTIFNLLIVTEAIKALSGFLDKSPYKKIIKLSIDIFKGNDITKTKVKTSPKPKPPGPQVNGGGYIVKLPNNLWKYGIVNDYNRHDNRMNEHLAGCIEKVELFTGKKIEYPSVMLCHRTLPINNYSAWEEAVGNILNEYNGNGIELFESDNGEREREYFICDNDDLITQIILERIKDI